MSILFLILMFVSRPEVSRAQPECKCIGIAPEKQPAHPPAVYSTLGDRGKVRGL